MKKLFKPLAVFTFLALGLSLASCQGGNNPAQTSALTPDPAPTSADFFQDELKFLAKGKMRIDINLEGVTIKLNGTTVTNGSVLDIPSTIAFTAEGKPQVNFYLYLASVSNNTLKTFVLSDIDKESTAEFMTTIDDEISAGTNKIYMALTTVKGGWTKGLDTKMDEQFQRFLQ